MARDQDFSRLPEKRLQLINTESFLLTTTLLSQLAFVLWMGFGTRSMNAVREFVNEPLLWILFAANLVCWSLVFAVRFFWQGFDYSSTQDTQTGLYHRVYFDRITEMEVRRAGRYKYPVTLCVLDIDKFASLNQNFGRRKGDDTLQEFADFLRACIRVTDFVARYESDEFCILLTHTDLVKSEKFISRVVAQAQERLDCSFSAGLAAFHPGESRQQFFERAHAALQQAKKEGTGKIRCLLAGQDSQAVLSF